MSFLFGDLTPAPFTTNYLEALRDAVDFASAIADADQCIATAGAAREALQRRAQEEIARLDALAQAIMAATNASDKGEKDSATATLASEMMKALAERHKAGVHVVKTKLAEDFRTLEAATVAAREDYFPLLEKYLLARDPPASAQALAIELAPGSKKDESVYTAEVIGRSELGLDWSIEVAVPSDGAWKAPLRVDRIMSGLAIVAPKLSGLIKKDVKPKKHKVDRHFLQKLVDDGQAVRIELRADLGGREGFDIRVAGRRVTLEKTGDDADDPTLGEFEVDPDDLELILELASKLKAMGRELPKRRLIAATLDDLPFDGTNAEAQPKLVEIVSRLATKLAPAVSEIARRSRAKDELVLRVALDDGRREEIFMPKERLRERFTTLDAPHQELFATFAQALSAVPPSEIPPVYETPEIEVVELPPIEIRQEVPASRPPVRRSSGNMAAIAVPIAVQPKPPDPRKKKPELVLASEPPAAAPPPSVYGTEEDLEEVVPVPVPSPPPPAPVLTVPPPSAKNEALVATLKHIRAIGKEGHLDEAFRQYAVLVASASFAECRAEDQRVALKLMMFGKAPSSPSEEMIAAHRAALPILQSLVLKHHEPADYEMLGMAYVALDQPEKATEIYKKALDIERARNPASDLCGNLMRRVSAL